MTPKENLSLVRMTNQLPARGTHTMVLFGNKNIELSSHELNLFVVEILRKLRNYPEGVMLSTSVSNLQILVKSSTEYSKCDLDVEKKILIKKYFSQLKFTEDRKNLKLSQSGVKRLNHAR